MTSRDFILESLQGPRANGDGANYNIYRFLPDEPGFEGFALRARKLSDGHLDWPNIRAQLGETTALYGTLAIPYYGVSKALYSQPLAAPDAPEPYFSIIPWLAGETLGRLMPRYADGGVSVFAEMDQSHFTHLMKQLRLAQEEGHSRDTNRNNIMVNFNPATGQPGFSMIDLTWNSQPRNYPMAYSNRPEAMIRTFFLYGDENRAKAEDTKRLLEKLVTGAEEARHPSRMSSSLKTIMRDIGNARYIREEWLQDAAARLTAITPSSPPPKEPVPEAVISLGALSLRESAAQLREYLTAILASKGGRGIE